MNRALLRCAVAVFALGVILPAGAQDQRRVDEILFHAEVRANGEADTVFGQGDFPKAIQGLRMRYELREWDERILTDLTWMLGNVEETGESLYYAIRFRQANPNDPNRGYPEALLYSQWRMFSKIPPILESDIAMVPPPHRNSYSLISTAYMRMGYHADAVRVLDIALKHYPDDAVFKRNRDRSAQLLKGG